METKRIQRLVRKPMQTGNVQLVVLLTINQTSSDYLNANDLMTLKTDNRPTIVDRVKEEV